MAKPSRLPYTRNSLCENHCIQRGEGGDCFFCWVFFCFFGLLAALLLETCASFLGSEGRLTASPSSSSRSASTPSLGSRSSLSGTHEQTTLDPDLARKNTSSACSPEVQSMESGISQVQLRQAQGASRATTSSPFVCTATRRASSPFRALYRGQASHSPAPLSQ